MEIKQESLGLAQTFAKLIRQARVGRYTQAELADRIGVSRNPITALEQGKAVSTSTLFDALVLLDLSDSLLENLNAQLDAKPEYGQRKRRLQEPELDNDF